jgi:hypothetical protein
MESYLKIDGMDIYGTTIEVLDPKLISSSMFMTRQQFEEQIEGLKKALAENSDSIVEFTYDDIDSWLVEHTNKNEDIENTLQNLSIHYREIEGELFNIKVKQEVIVALLRDYIKNWLNNSIAKIYEISAEAVTINPITSTNKSTKKTSTSK